MKVWYFTHRETGATYFSTDQHKRCVGIEEEHGRKNFHNFFDDDKNFYKDYIPTKWKWSLGDIIAILESDIFENEEKGLCGMVHYSDVFKYNPETFKMLY